MLVLLDKQEVKEKTTKVTCVHKRAVCMDGQRTG